MNKNTLEYIQKCEEKLQKKYQEIDNISLYNSNKVLSAFQKNKVSESHFNGTTGYGYNDEGRDIIEKVYKDIFVAEDALVRTQFISGTHAISTTLFALLRPNDIMLSISGKPYDTLDEIIGLKENPSSLKSYGIKYMEIDLIENDFNYEKIKEVLTHNKIKLIEIQRSKGYSTRESLSIEKIEKVIKYIKNIDKDVIIMIDNCYCEFVTTKEPIEVGADIAVGSLIKNLGGALASNGGYVVGREDLVNLVSERLNPPGQGKEVGPSLGANKGVLQGLFLSPSVVASALKTALLTSLVMEEKGYKTSPKSTDERVDIVQNIIFEDVSKLIKYCKLVQASSPIDSFVTPEPSPMPGYTDKVIMASGSFTQGSSIELSADGPLRPPYIAYQQGSITYDYGKLMVMKLYENIEKNIGN